MASADFYGFTRCITAGRAVWSDGAGPVRSLESGHHNLAPGRFGYRTTQPSLPSAPALERRSPQIDAHCRCTSAEFTVGCAPVGLAAMCQRQQHPSALTMRFLFVASHLLRAGFVRIIHRGFALVFGSWLSLLTMSSSRYSHRGPPPHKFAPMLGAHHSLNQTHCGRPLIGLQKPSPNANLPQWAGYLKILAAYIPFPVSRSIINNK